MAIPRSTPLHGTGHTVGEILDAAAEAGGGGSYTLPVATGSVLGGVKIGSGVTAAEDGTISVAGGDVGTEFTVADNGQFIINGLSTNDPSVENAIWSDGGVLVQSGHTAPSGGGSPQPGQPTRFLTLTYTHPGNEDGNSESATTGIPIPDSAITEGTAWLVAGQVRVSSADPAFFCAGFAGGDTDGKAIPHIYSKFGGTVSFKNGAGGANMVFLFDLSSAPNSDPMFSPRDIALTADVLNATFTGMSTNTPTDWTINVQLTPIAP